MEQQKSKGGCCLAFLVTILAVFMALVWLADYGIDSVLDQINRVDQAPTLSEEEIQQIEGGAEDPGAEKDDWTVPPGSAPPIKQEDQIINILLIGQDRRGGTARQRSDTMILCTIDPEAKTVVMTSFLRDLYVDIPNWDGHSYQDNRLNVCYALGGMGLLDAALRKNFGVEVDHNVEVDFSGFEDIVSQFGGVPVNLTKAEAEYLGGGLREGLNRLDAQQALAFVRIRKLDSDFGRTERQRRLLNGMLGAMQKMSYNHQVKLINSILPMITTDMTNDEIKGYMRQLLPILWELEVTTQYIPASGTYRNASIRGMSVLVPDLEANRAILEETLN